MRVRHLQSHLHDEKLIYQHKLQALQGQRLGIDAVHWLRSIQALKDPFADALGGVPPGIFGVVDKELEGFRRLQITPVFIFQGMTPGPKHSMFVNRMDQQMMDAWALLASGHNSEAQKFFAVSTSRINGDFVYFIFQHMRYRGCEVLQAPYFAGTQLVHFAEQGVVQAVFGPPGLLLFGLSKVIINIDFQNVLFDWIDLERILEKWTMTREQFVDACMLAGTEYCLTFPYLQVDQVMRFNFDVAVNVAKQAPLVQWMHTFPTEEIKADHMEGYCVCKLLIQSSPVYSVTENAVRPSALSGAVPSDYPAVLGALLPSSLYFLIVSGVLSAKLPQALAKGEWLDKSQPLVDTQEYRQLLSDLTDYRQRALGLIARHLPPYFRNKRILCKAFWEHLQNRRTADPGRARRYLQPEKMQDIIRWNINATNVAQELHRQSIKKVDFKFCLAWHANEVLKEGPLISDLQRETIPENHKGNDTKAISAIVHFMLLEHLGLIADDGAMTVLGDVLKDSPRQLQEPCLVALEMMKFGILSGEPFEAAERPFPEQVKYPKSPVDSNTKSMLLLSRVMSLVPRLTYQKTLGVDHVHLDAEDSFVKAGGLRKPFVKRMMREGFLTVDVWNEYLGMWEIWYHNQGLVYEDCPYRFRGVYDYIIMLDTDDFFTPRNPREPKVHYYINKYCRRNNVGSCKFRWVEYFPDAYGFNNKSTSDGNITRALRSYSHYNQGNPKSLHQTTALIDTATHYAYIMMPKYKIFPVPVSVAYVAHVRKWKKPPGKNGGLEEGLPNVGLDHCISRIFVAMLASAVLFSVTILGRDRSWAF